MNSDNHTDAATNATDAQAREHQERLERYGQGFLQVIRLESPLGQEMRQGLRQLQQSLELADQDTEAIEAKVTHDLQTQNQAYKESLYRYEQEFSDAIRQEFPLSSANQKRLWRLQESLGLQSIDVIKIEGRLLSKKGEQTHSINALAKGDSAVIAPHSLQKLVQQVIAATRALETSNGSHAQNNLQSHTQDRTESPLTAAKLDILRALDKRPYTTQDLLSFMSITTPPDQVRAIVQSLWLQGYIDTISGGLLRKFFPVSKGQSPQLPDPDASLTLTSKGHFSVHPIFRFGSPRAMFR
jgi:hypothetical protein